MKGETAGDVEARLDVVRPRPRARSDALACFVTHRPNAVLAKVGAGGKVCIYTLAGTDIVVDVNGYVP